MAEITEIELGDAWEMLRADPDAVLVDVRTEQEWQYVGAPDLTEIGKSPVFVSWAPGTRNESFVDDLRSAGVHDQQPVLLLCRSGVRSRSAARLLIESGFHSCLNISAGFEGPLDGAGHRNGGWRSVGMPWRQS